MNHNKLFVLLISMFFHFNVMEARDYVQYVDPYIGSGGHGHVFVGASVPFGAMRWDRRIYIKVGIGVLAIIILIV